MTTGGKTSIKSGTLAVGIGSPYGDDQIGWIAMQELAAAMRGEIDVKQAGQPAELLDWLQDVEQLIICDACLAGGTAGDIHRWEWPCDSFATRERAGSHDLSLPFVLSLAARLGKLPPRVVVWGIELGDASPGAPLSNNVRSAVSSLIKQMIAEIRGTPCEVEPHHA